MESCMQAVRLFTFLTCLQRGNLSFELGTKFGTGLGTELGTGTN